MHPWLSVPAYKDLIPRCQHLEKRVFPKSEAMDLSSELKKPNQYLFVALQRADAESLQLLAYGVLALSRIDRTARISKICTDPGFRRQGAGGLVVRSMLRALGACDVESAEERISQTIPLSKYICLPTTMEICAVQLHVDKARAEAIRLYTRCGFGVKTVVPSYYAEGRDALLMTRDINCP
ncbi:polarity establishment/cellular polarization [Linderina macrospora]|uniref:Polarity establishment/cellular polarization n=1 Tax=Linderina macrospora TaxID=4868 RepID=A0ACC1J790_9FUNG|nr:polarity establishment/cellular polarization [Linderina macrospora]